MLGHYAFVSWQLDLSWPWFDWLGMVLVNWDLISLG